MRSPQALGRAGGRARPEDRRLPRASRWGVHRTACSSIRRYHHHGRRGPWAIIDPFDLAARLAAGASADPLLYVVGLMQWEDVSYGWALFAVYGAVQVAVTFAVCVRWSTGARWSGGRPHRRCG